MDTKATVLIVEDDPFLQRLYKMVIDASGEFTAKVYTGDFRKVIETVNWETINVVVADQSLGRWVYGSTLLKYLQKEHPDIWRIMLTGDSLINPIKTFCDVLLFKPIYPDELVTSLRSDRGQSI